MRHLRSTVYATTLNDMAELQQRVEDRCGLIRNTPGILERVRQLLMRHAARCVEAQGQQSEQFCNLLLSRQ
jgi:hypothetical protein